MPQLKFNFYTHSPQIGHHDCACYVDEQGRFGSVQGRTVFYDDDYGADTIYNGTLNLQDAQTCREPTIGYIFEQNDKYLTVGGLLFVANNDGRGIVPSGVRVRFPKAQVPQNPADVVRMVTEMTDALAAKILNKDFRIARELSAEAVAEIAGASMDRIKAVASGTKDVAADAQSRFNYAVPPDSATRSRRNAEVLVVSRQDGETDESLHDAMEQEAAKRLTYFLREKADVNGRLSAKQESVALVTDAQFARLTRYEPCARAVSVPRAPAVVDARYEAKAPVTEAFAVVKVETGEPVAKINQTVQPGIDQLLALAAGPNGEDARKTLSALVAKISTGLGTPPPKEG